MSQGEFSQRPALAAATADLRAGLDGLTIDPTGDSFVQRGHINGWLVLGGYELRDPGGLVLTWLSLVPDGSTPGLHITSGLLRLINHGRLLDGLRRRLLHVDELTRAAKHAVTGRPARWPGPDQQATGRRADPRRQRQLRIVALAYLEEVKKGPGVYRRLIGRYPRLGDQQGARAEVRAARADRWLGAARHGTTSAEPGPRLLAEADPSTTDG